MTPLPDRVIDDVDVGVGVGLPEPPHLPERVVDVRWRPPGGARLFVVTTDENRGSTIWEFEELPNKRARLVFEWELWADDMIFGGRTKAAPRKRLEAAGYEVIGE